VIAILFTVQLVTSDGHGNLEVLQQLEDRMWLLTTKLRSEERGHARAARGGPRRQAPAPRHAADGGAPRVHEPSWRASAVTSFSSIRCRGAGAQLSAIANCVVNTTAAIWSSVMARSTALDPIGTPLASAEDYLVHVVERAVAEALGRYEVVTRLEAHCIALEQRDELAARLRRQQVRHAVVSAFGSKPRFAGCTPGGSRRVADTDRRQDAMQHCVK
jgi:hypothetical protein